MKAHRDRILGIAAIGLLAAVSIAPTTGVAQRDDRNNRPVSKSLAVQLRELQTKVAKLEAALKQKHAGRMSSGMQGRSGIKDMMAKGKGMKDGMGMGAMTGKRMTGKGMSGKKMGGKGMSGMAMM